MSTFINNKPSCMISMSNSCLHWFCSCYTYSSCIHLLLFDRIGSPCTYDIYDRVEHCRIIFERVPNKHLMGFMVLMMTIPSWLSMWRIQATILAASAHYLKQRLIEVMKIQIWTLFWISCGEVPNYIVFSANNLVEAQYVNKTLF